MADTTAVVAEAQPVKAEEKADVPVEETKDAAPAAPADEPDNFDPTTMAAVRKQVEFYFDDSNYNRDKFLKGTCAKHPEKYIELKLLMSFKRMQSLTSDKDLTVAALKGSDVVSFNEDKTMIRRKQKIPLKDPTLSRCIYAKGFPDESTIESIAEFFAPQGPVKCVRLRRDNAKKFKGSVFVEFAEQSVADMVAEMKEVNGKELLLMKKKAYVTMKVAEHKKAEAEERAAGKGKKRSAEEAGLDGAKKEPRSYIPGLLIRFKGFGEEITRQDLKPILGEHGDVAFIEMDPDGLGALVRFREPQDSKTTVEAFKEKNIEVKGKAPEVSVLAGDEEKEYWNVVWTKWDEKSNSGRGRGRRAGRGGGRGRGRGKRQRTN